MLTGEDYRATLNDGRQIDIAKRSVDAVVLFVEPHLVLGQFHTALGNVIAIVQAKGEHLPGMRNRRVQRDVIKPEAFGARHN